METRFEPQSLSFFFFTTCHFGFCQHWKVTLMVATIISIAKFSGSLPLLDSVTVRQLLKTLVLSNAGNKVKYEICTFK